MADQIVIQDTSTQQHSIEIKTDPVSSVEVASRPWIGRRVANGCHTIAKLNCTKIVCIAIGVLIIGIFGVLGIVGGLVGSNSTDLQTKNVGLGLAIAGGGGMTLGVLGILAGGLCYKLTECMKRIKESAINKKINKNIIG